MRRNHPWKGSNNSSKQATWNWPLRSKTKTRWISCLFITANNADQCERLIRSTSSRSHVKQQHQEPKHSILSRYLAVFLPSLLSFVCCLSLPPQRLWLSDRHRVQPIGIERQKRDTEKKSDKRKQHTAYQERIMRRMRGDESSRLNTRVNWINYQNVGTEKKETRRGVNGEPVISDGDLLVEIRIENVLCRLSRITVTVWIPCAAEAQSVWRTRCCLWPCVIFFLHRLTPRPTATSKDWRELITKCRPVIALFTLVQPPQQASTRESPTSHPLQMRWLLRSHWIELQHKTRYIDETD